MAQAHLTHICDGVCVALHQATRQAGLHICCCHSLQEDTIQSQGLGQWGWSLGCHSTPCRMGREWLHKRGDFPLRASCSQPFTKALGSSNAGKARQLQWGRPGGALAQFCKPVVKCLLEINRGGSIHTTESGKGYKPGFLTCPESLSTLVSQSWIHTLPSLSPSFLVSHTCSQVGKRCSGGA